VRTYAVALGASSRTALPATAPLPLPDKPSLAVLPFQNMSGDPEQEYFTDGMVEDIITELSRFRALLVIARNSTFTYKGKAVDVRQVARELGVRYVVEGSIRKAGERVRVTAQLIDAATGSQMCSPSRKKLRAASWQRWRRGWNWQRSPMRVGRARTPMPFNVRGAPRAY